MEITNSYMSRLFVELIDRPLAQIGRQLAAVGDDINERYRPQFSRMISSLNITPETAYDLFAEVARKFVYTNALLLFCEN